MFSLYNNVLSRELSIRLRFDAPLSYEDFVGNEEYLFLFDENAKSEVVRGLTFRGFYSLWELRGLQSYELIFERLLENSVCEMYHNADQLFPNLSEQSNLLYKVQSGEPLSKEEEGLLCFYLDDVKFSITNNRYFYKLYDDLVFCRAKLVTPFWEDALITNDHILTRGQKRALRKRINLVQEEREHQIVEYLLFVILTTDIDLFLLLNPTCNQFVITSQNEINNQHHGGFGFFICISKLIRSFVERSSIKFLDDVRSKYRHDDGNAQFIEDLLGIVRKSPSSRIQVKANNGKITDLSFSNRDQNLDNYPKLKEYKRGEPGVTRTTAIEEYGTKKNAVVATGRIKYGKKK